MSKCTYFVFRSRTSANKCYDLQDLLDNCMDCFHTATEAREYINKAMNHHKFYLSSMELISYDHETRVMVYVSF